MLWKSAKPQAALVRLGFRVLSLGFRVGVQQIDEGLGLEGVGLTWTSHLLIIMALGPKMLGRWAISVAIWEVHVAQFGKP